MTTLSKTLLTTAGQSMAIVALVAACSSGGLADTPERVMEGRELFYFESLEQMVATSEVVMKGRVVAVRPGRWVGVPGSKDADRVRDITVAVEEVLFSTTTPAPTIHVDEWGWDSKGNGFQFGNVAWTEKGTVAYYFLKRVDGQSNTYRLISSQGRVIVDGQELTSSAAVDDALNTIVEAMDEAKLRASVRGAAEGFRAGTVVPLPTPGHG